MTETTEQVDLLQTFLAERDAPCPRCGYNLRALHSRTCPECGEELRLTVGLVHPKLGWFLTGLLGLAAGAGFSGLLVIYILVHVLFGRWGGGPPPEFYTVVLGGCVVEGGALVCYLVAARRVRQAALGTRVLLALACCALSLANIVVFSLMVR